MRMGVDRKFGVGSWT